MSNQNIPKFESRVNITPAGSPNVQSSFAALGSVFGQISQGALAIGQRVADKQASLAGTEAGEEPGLVLKPPINKATEAFNRAAISSNKSFLDANVRQSYSELYKNVVNPKNFNSLESDPIGKFKQESPGIAADILSNALPENKLATKNAINYYHGKYLTNIAAKVHARSFNAAVVHGKNILSGEADEAKIAGAQNNKNAIEGHYSNFKNAVDNQVRTGIISPKQGALEELFLEESVTSNQVIGGMAEAVASGGSEGGSKFIADLIKADHVMAPMQKESLVAKTKGMLIDHETNARVDLAVLVKNGQDQLDSIIKGEPADVTRTIATMAETHPQVAKQFQAQYATSKFAANHMKAYRFAPQAERQRQLAAGIEVLRKNPSKNTRRGVNTLIKMAKRQTQTMIDDPGGYFQAAPSVKNALAASQMAVSAQQDGNDAVPEFIKKRDLISPQMSARKGAKLTPHAMDVSLALQKEANVPEDKRAIYSNNQRAALVESFNAMPPLPRTLAVTKFLSLQENQGHGTMILGGLIRSGLTKMTTSTMAMASTPASRADVSLSIQSQGWTTKEYAANQKNVKDGGGEAVTGVRSAILDNQEFKDYENSVISGSTTDTSTARNELQDNIMRLAYALNANGVSENMTDAVKRATADMIGNNFNFTSINGHSLRVPKSIPVDVVIPYLQQAKKNALEGNIQPSRGWLMQRINSGLPRSILNNNYIQGLADTSYWATLPNNGGMILLDDTKSPVLTEGGHKIIVKNKDINSPMSEINQQINESDQPSGQSLIPGSLAFQTGQVASQALAAPTTEQRNAQVALTTVEIGRQNRLIKIAADLAKEGIIVSAETLAQGIEQVAAFPKEVGPFVKRQAEEFTGGFEADRGRDT